MGSKKKRKTERTKSRYCTMFASRYSPQRLSFLGDQDPMMLLQTVECHEPDDDEEDEIMRKLLAATVTAAPQVMAANSSSSSYVYSPRGRGAAMHTNKIRTVSPPPPSAASYTQDEKEEESTSDENKDNDEDQHQHQAVTIQAAFQDLLNA